MSSTPDRTEAVHRQHSDEEKGLHRTVTGVTMSPELFEKVDALQHERRSCVYMSSVLRNLYSFI